jgi:hypothetical protein
MLETLRSLNKKVKMSNELDNEIQVICSSLFVMIIVIGITGNSLNAVVFSKPDMRKKSTYRLLLYRSILDLILICVCTTDSLLVFGNI